MGGVGFRVFKLQGECTWTFLLFDCGEVLWLMRYRIKYPPETKGL